MEKPTMRLSSWLRTTRNRLFSRTARPGPRRRPPALERLDDRLCPSSTATVAGGHVLQILGDRSDNRIAIVDQGVDGISVALDGAPARTFRDIDQIVLNTYAGNDAVSYQ